jgi:hypothetical protein
LSKLRLAAAGSFQARGIGEEMVRSMEATKKARRARRPGARRLDIGFDPVRAVRMSDALTARIDSWANWQDDQPARSEALRRLIELGLTVDRLWEDLATKLAATPLKVPAPDLAHRGPPQGQDAAEEHREKDRETATHGS